MAGVVRHAGGRLAGSLPADRVQPDARPGGGPGIAKWGFLRTPKSVSHKQVATETRIGGAFHSGPMSIDATHRATRNLPVVGES